MKTVPFALPTLNLHRYIYCDCGAATSSVQEMAQHKAETGCPWLGAPDEAALFLQGGNHPRQEQC